MDAFNDESFIHAFWYTALYAIVSLFIINVLAFLIAYLLTLGIKGANLFRTAFFMPNLIGGIVLGYIWSMIFNGVLGKINTSILMETRYGFWGLIILMCWQQIGYMMIIYIAGIQNIPGELIEAAKIDGANEFQVFTKICIPICKGVITTCAILVFMDYWNMVEQPLLFFNDTDKYPLSIFLSKINAQEVGLAFAVATFYMIPSLLIFLYGEDQLVEGIAYQGGVKG